MNLEGLFQNIIPFLIQSENHRTTLPTVGWMRTLSALDVPGMVWAGAKNVLVISGGYGGQTLVSVLGS